MTPQEKFLAIYKEYETLVRASGKDPKDVETEISGVNSSRLYMCRQFRNYIVHVSDPGFIIPTESMTKFLQGQINELKARGDTAKKHLKKPAMCILQESSKVSEAIEKFTKLNRETLLVQGKSGWLQLSIYDILGMRSTSRISILTKPTAPHFCAPLDCYASLDFSRPVICTDDGTKDGKLLGQVWES